MQKQHKQCTAFWNQSQEKMRHNPLVMPHFMSYNLPVLIRFNNLLITLVTDITTTRIYLSG